MARGLSGSVCSSCAAWLTLNAHFSRTGSMVGSSASRN
jgi:hypothetical protein